MKLLILCFVIIATSLSVVSSEELETRKTVKKASPLIIFNDPRARVDEIPLESDTTAEVTLKVESNEISAGPETTTEKVKESTTVAEVSTSEATTTTQKSVETSTTEKLQENSNESESNETDDGNDDDDSHEVSHPPSISNIIPGDGNPKRKVLYVNQQQNGKLNVHLELSDVSVIVIPNQKDPQLSLLNLLFKSAQKSSLRNEAKKKEENFKSAESHHEEYSKYKLPVHDESLIGHLPLIESRAPYKVDISSISGLPSQSSQPLVDITPNSQQINARSPVMHLVKPAAGPAQSPHRVFRRSIDTRLLGIDAEIPKEEEEELTESNFNSVDSDNEFNTIDSSEESEFVLLGATENCGPGRKRNSYQICVAVES